jgi:hypothetical protein
MVNEVFARARRRRILIARLAARRGLQSRIYKTGTERREVSPQGQAPPLEGVDR